MGSIDYHPTRAGYRLTEEGEQALRNWQEDYQWRGGCTCWQSAPCSICYHEYHPYCIEETDKYWVKEEEEMSRDKIIDKSKEKSVEYKVGDKVRIIGNTNSHCYKIGDIVTLKEKYISHVTETHFWCTGLDDGYVQECDIEPYNDKEEVSYSKVEYKAGDKVKIIGNTCSHKYELGDIVTLVGDKEKYPGGGWYWDTNDKKGCSCVRECDIEPYEDYKQRVEIKVKRTIDWLTYEFKNETNQQTKGDLNMSITQRKSVVVNLIDRDSALDDKHSLVASFGTFTTSKGPEALIRSIIMDPKNKVAQLIEQHNEVRSKQVNKEVLLRTGNKVMLEPIEESDLHWEIQ